MGLARKSHWRTPVVCAKPDLLQRAGMVTWAGTDSNRSVNVMPLGPQGLTPGTKTTMSSFNSVASPTIAADPRRQPVAAHLDPVRPGNLTLATSSRWRNWTLPSESAIITDEYATPDVLALATKPTNGYTYYWMWAASLDAHLLSLAHADDLAPGLPLRHSLEPAVGGPQLGFHWSILAIWCSSGPAPIRSITSTSQASGRTNPRFER